MIVIFTENNRLIVASTHTLQEIANLPADKIKTAEMLADIISFAYQVPIQWGRE